MSWLLCLGVAFRNNWLRITSESISVDFWEVLPSGDPAECPSLSMAPDSCFLSFHVFLSSILVWLSLGPEASTSPGLRWVLSLVWIWLSWNLSSSFASSLNSRLIRSPWESFALGCTLVSKGKTEAKGLDTGIMLNHAVSKCDGDTCLQYCVFSWCSSWANHFLPPYSLIHKPGASLLSV